MIVRNNIIIIYGMMMVDCDNDDTGDGNNIYGDGLM